MQLGQSRILRSSYVRPVIHIRNFYQPQVSKAFAEPGPVIERFVGQRIGIAAAKYGTRRQHCFNDGSIRAEQCKECGIATCRIRQLGKITPELFNKSIGIQILDVDGNLGLKSVHGTAVSLAGLGPPTSYWNGVRLFAIGRFAHLAMFTAIVECIKSITVVLHQANLCLEGYLSAA